MGEVLQHDHVRQPSAQSLPVLSIPLLLGIVRSRLDARQDLVERVDHASLKEGKGDLRRRLRSGREGLEQMGVRCRREGGRAASGQEEVREGFDEADVKDGFKRFGPVSVGLDGAKDSEGGLLNEALIGVSEDVSKHGEGVSDHVELVLGGVSTTVGGGGDGGSLDVGVEEVEEVEKSAEAAFFDDGGGVLLGDLLEGLDESGC
jgi:hypothetical protein